MNSSPSNYHFYYHKRTDLGHMLKDLNKLFIHSAQDVKHKTHYNSHQVALATNCEPVHLICRKRTTSHLA